MSLIKVIYGKTGSSTYQIPHVNAQSHTLEAIDFWDAQILAGNSFMAWYNANVADAANHDILITTPNTTKWAHLRFKIEVEGMSSIYLYEGPTTTAVGTGLTGFNRNRNSSTTATTVVTHTPTVTVVGTAIQEWTLGFAKVLDEEDVIILKQNTKYLLRVTNISGGTSYTAVRVSWHEHTNETA